MTRGYTVFADILEADDGHPQMGKELAQHLQGAGFADIRVSDSFETFAGPERLKLFYELGQQWFFTDDVQTPATQYGAANAGMMEEMRLATERWYRSPGALAAFAFGEALALKP